MIERWPTKDPDEELDYEINWIDLLTPGDTIQTSTWFVPVGITRGLEGQTSTSTSIWLTGGTAGNTYSLTNRVTTPLGRTHEQSVKLKVNNK